MLKVQKRSELFFDRKVVFSFCSTGHLKKVLTNLLKISHLRFRKAQKKFIRKNEIPSIFPRTQGKQFPTGCQKFSHNIRQKVSFGAPEQLKFLFQKLPSDFPLEHGESSFDFNTEFSLANSGKFSLKSRKFLPNNKSVAKFPQRLTLDTSNAVLKNLL